MRIALISDIHEDIQYLNRALKRIEKKGADLIICLGDISGFSIPHYKYSDLRNAHECLLILREKCDIILPGNHDFHAGRIIPQSSEIFNFPDNWYDLDYRKKFNLANDSIWLHEENDLDPLYTPGDIEFLRSLPEYHVLETEKLNILLSHYVYPNLSGFKKGFYTSPGDFIEHFHFMNKLSCQISFTGHAHVKGFYMVSKSYFGHYKRKRLEKNNSPLCIGIPPVTRNNNRSGFCIFDVERLFVQTFSC